MITWQQSLFWSKYSLNIITKRRNKYIKLKWNSNDLWPDNSIASVLMQYWIHIKSLNEEIIFKLCMYLGYKSISEKLSWLIENVLLKIVQINTCYFIKLITSIQKLIDLECALTIMDAPTGGGGWTGLAPPEGFL